MTHQHYDHNRLELPAKNPGCVIWQNTDALQNGVYQTLTLDFATAEAVEAYNHHHPKAECVGYIVTADGVSIYFAGDTGETEEMAKMAARNLDYAVLPMDYTYTMDIDETIRCAKLIGAKHTIPVHMAPGKLFDRARAEIQKRGHHGGGDFFQQQFGKRRIECIKNRREQRKANRFFLCLFHSPPHFTKRSIASDSASSASRSPFCTASETQCLIWSFKISLPVLLIADFTAASCTKTSGQSLPSSTICRTASKCPIARESRFKTCFVDS